MKAVRKQGLPACPCGNDIVKAMIALEGRSTGIPMLLGAIVALAALDFVGAVLAKEWAQGRNHWLFVGGLVTFGALFTVYAIILKVAELSTVTLGWMVFLQVGLMVIERVRYDVTLPTGKWVAIVAVLLLQAYLILAPNGEPAKSVRDSAHEATAVGHRGGLASGGDLELPKDVRDVHARGLVADVQGRRDLVVATTGRDEAGRTGERG